jgi:hypothetical protein
MSLYCTLLLHVGLHSNKNRIPTVEHYVRFFTQEATGTSTIKISVTLRDGRAMAQAVSRLPPTVEARVRSRVSPCGICGGQSGIGTGFSPEFFCFPVSISFHWCSIARKRTKITIIFITGLHNKPHGCSASVASDAGPSTTKRKHFRTA